MSNQPEKEMPQPATLTPQELRESLLAELEASKQIIAELSDEQMEAITGARRVLVTTGGNRNAVAPAPEPVQPPDRTRSAPPPTPDPFRVTANLPRTLRRTRSAGPVPEAHAHLRRIEDMLLG